MSAATAVNPEASSGISIGYSVSSMAEWLRRITVCLRGPRGSRGSGVVWRDGLIVTNAHVAVGKGHTVVFSDGTSVQGRLAARDPAVDLAALAIDATGLPVASVRGARSLRPGEVVLAVGNPWDGEGAVSAGIVHRAAGQGAVIFADIRLAPGNSGGPLADAEGNVVGVNSAIFQGLGCAVSSETVMEFLRQAGLLEAA
ncbi:serine protease [Acidobacteria bacterium AB60]|nr:serine protease [Acidobacteria bacterium AB60]